MAPGGIFGLLTVRFGNELESCMCGLYWAVGCCRQLLVIAWMYRIVESAGSFVAMRSICYGGFLEAQMNGM